MKNGWALQKGSACYGDSIIMTTGSPIRATGGAASSGVRVEDVDVNSLYFLAMRPYKKHIYANAARASDSSAGWWRRMFP